MLRMIHPREWMEVRPGGLYCKPGGFFVDPTRAVEQAIVTHGHSDHARPGHAKAIATPDTLAIMACRLGEGFAQARVELPYGQAIHLGEARVTLYPAGHILGSAQVSIEYGGARLVVSGDYNRAHSPRRARVRAYRVRCIRDRGNLRAAGVLPPGAAARNRKATGFAGGFPESCHLVGCYALGKTQRIYRGAAPGGL